jgi:hypothetical protein
MYILLGHDSLFILLPVGLYSYLAKLAKTSGVSLCGLTRGCQRFGGTYRLHVHRQVRIDIVNAVRTSSLT